MDRYTLLQKIGIYICIAIFMTFILLPFFEMFRTSLSPMSHLFHAPYELWSDEFSFAAYSAMWVKVPLLGRYIWNSIFIASSVTAITMLFVIPAAYAYARLDFPFKTQSLGIFLSVNMFAGAVLLIPLYRVMRTLGLLNTYWSMIIPGVAFLIPTGIWLLRGYLEKIPKELEEAAYVDGASRLYTLRRVVLPLARPGLVVVGATSATTCPAERTMKSSPAPWSRTISGLTRESEQLTMMAKGFWPSASCARRLASVEVFFGLPVR